MDTKTKTIFYRTDFFNEICHEVNSNSFLSDVHTKKCISDANIN